jgi:hypothetical protein
MPSSSAPRRSDACSSASASQKLDSYASHDPIEPIRRTRPASASIYELVADAGNAEGPGLASLAPTEMKPARRRSPTTAISLQRG